MTLTGITPMSLGKMLGGLYIVLGLIGGVLLSLAGEFIKAALGMFPPGEFGGDDYLGEMFGLHLILVMPLVYGAIGFVTGLVVAHVYNWLAGVFGGIELHLASDDAPDLEVITRE